MYKVQLLAPFNQLHLVAQLLAIEVRNDATDGYPKDCGDQDNGH